MNPRRILSRAGLATLVVAAVLTVVFVANENNTKVTSESGLLAPGTAALRAALDPETGSLVTGPDAHRILAGTTGGDKATDAEMARMLSRSTEGLHEVHHPDGRVSVNLQGRFMNASVARLGADGAVEQLCAEDLAEAEAFLAGAASAEPAPTTDANGWEVR